METSVTVRPATARISYLFEASLDLDDRTDLALSDDEGPTFVEELEELTTDQIEIVKQDGNQNVWTIKNTENSK